jgi:hypothetical protein
MRALFGIAIAAVLAVTIWSVGPTIGKTRAIASIDPLGMMTTTTNLPSEQYDAF